MNEIDDFGASILKKTLACFSLHVFPTGYTHRVLSVYIRYQILAASAIPAGFIDGKVAAGKLLEALQLDESEYKLGNTKVFFRSGIVGDLEEMRDERLSKIMSQFQAYCKAILARVEFKKMCDQR